MFHSQYYTCEQVDERLLQGYVDDFNEVNSTNYSKENLLLKLFQAINWDQVFGKYQENPEFVRVYLDATNKVLWGIRINGDIYYGAGVPSQIKNYIDSKISESPLNRVEDILIFLDDLIDSDKTLKELLLELYGDLDIKKVDKEEGKSLIDSDFASGVQYIENPEFISVKLDANDHILEANCIDGSKLFGFGIKVNGDMIVKALLSCQQLSLGGNHLYSTEDTDEYVEILFDGEEKIISCRKKDGTKVEKVGIETPLVKAGKMELSSDGITDLEKALKANGFTGGQGDWSDYISNDGDYPLVIPNFPKRAIINLHTDFNLINLSKKGRPGAVQGTNYDIPTQIEFWDMQGNYFKKWALISGQGNSSMGNAKKNIAIDLFDTSVYDSKGKLGKGEAFSVKFGDWVAQDSYHLKANVDDTFKMTNNLTYKFYDALVKTRGLRKDYMWKKALIDFSQISSSGVASEEVARTSLTNGAKCFPDGFPAVVYQNGSFWGIFFMSLKKHRDNFVMNKKTAEHVHLDGLLDSESIFMANGNVDWAMFTSKRANYEGRMDGIEVRNPKDLYCVTPVYSYIKLTDAEEIRRAGLRGNAQVCEDYKTSLSDSQIREQFGDNPPVYFHNEDADEWYMLQEGVSSKCDKYDADINNHELIDEDMPCYMKNEEGQDLDPDDADDAKVIKFHKTTNKVKKYIKNFSKIMTTIDAAEQVYLESEQTAADLATLKAVFETYFDVENLIDYMIIGDATDNWDGFRGKNWQWFTYDGVKWYCGLYDCDLTFSGAAALNQHVCEQSRSMPQYTLLMNRYIITYYQDDLNARYKEVRDAGILDKDFFTNLAESLIESIGKGTFEMEWEKWNFVPSDSIYRLQRWMEKRIENLDVIYSYTQL